MVVSEVVGTLSFLKPQPDDDFVDRLHYYYTSTFLLVAAAKLISYALFLIQSQVLMSLKMFGGRPIECWVPAEYRGGWEDYTDVLLGSKHLLGVIRRGNPGKYKRPGKTHGLILSMDAFLFRYLRLSLLCALLDLANDV
ncbi:unnamed protein product [Gongylonema pulchrum]|uniref:Innexin n=1 Tax=Gongylonema pulchrum TaxID=637853 RepID=A0A183D3G8_9BILA|nr:unnamed protein product [Gongylonema pulchrum]